MTLEGFGLLTYLLTVLMAVHSVIVGAADTHTHPTNVHSSNVADPSSEIPDEIRKMMAEHDPFPGSHPGINILPLQEILKDSSPAEIKKHRNAMQSIAKRGYELTHRTDQTIRTFAQYKKEAAEEIRDHDDSKDPYYSTHMKSSPEKVGISFHFNGIPGIDKKNVIGFAAANSHIPGKGWNGIAEFFEDEKLGVCHYKVIHIVKIFLPKENLKYLVNHKPSDSRIAGNPQVGFVYNVSWYHEKPTRMHELECANKIYDPNLIPELIKIAEKEDKSFDALNLTDVMQSVNP